jgi:hypothetical protein
VAATVLEHARQYEIKLTALGDQQTKVVATPHAFENERDTSDYDNWVLDHPADGERQRWKQLFERVRSLLPAS